jgi:hypothetical protein
MGSFRLSQFAGHLNEQGLGYNRQKLNLYYERGKVPEPDLVVGGTKYWYIKTVRSFGDDEKKQTKLLHGGLFKSILFLTPIFVLGFKTESLFWIRVSLPSKKRRKKRNTGILTPNVPYIQVRDCLQS